MGFKLVKFCSTRLLRASREPRNMHRGSDGQIAIEMVLLLAFFLFIAITISSLLRNQQILQKVIQAPWAALSGMIEHGMWQPPTPQAMALHPNSINRQRSLRGDTP